MYNCELLEGKKTVLLFHLSPLSGAHYAVHMEFCHQIDNKHENIHLSF